MEIDKNTALMILYKVYILSTQVKMILLAKPNLILNVLLVFKSF